MNLIAVSGVALGIAVSFLIPTELTDRFMKRIDHPIEITQQTDTRPLVETSVKIPPAPQPVVCSDKNVKADATITLACNIQKEAGTQSINGKLAVAQVTVNRTKDHRYPKTVQAVVWQPKQFSWTHEKTRHKKPHYVSWEESWKAAVIVLEGKYRTSEQHKNALWYHNTSVKPKWAKTFKECGRIEDHIFYCDPKEG